MEKELALLGTIVVLVTAIAAVLAWQAWWDKYYGCAVEERNDPTDCLTGVVQDMPPIKEAEAIAEACEKSDLECMKAVGQKGFEDKVIP